MHKFTDVPQAMKIPHARAAVDKEWEKLEKLPAWQMTQAKSKKRRSSWKSEKEQRAVHFATLMDICHLKKAELEPKYQMYKSPVVFRVESVKDDSGSHTVSTEQNSSASLQDYLILQDKQPTEYLPIPK